MGTTKKPKVTFYCELEVHQQLLSRADENGMTRLINQLLKQALKNPPPNIGLVELNERMKKIEDRLRMVEMNLGGGDEI